MTLTSIPRTDAPRGDAENMALMRLAGDDLIVQPRYRTTRAIVIAAPATTIYAWLVQIGAGRGGFYSFDRLENLAGMNIRSADRIMPELQRLAVGDVVPLSAAGGPIVAMREPGEAMVLHYVMDPFTARPVARDGRRWFDWSWAFILQPIDARRTRLVVRAQADYAPHLLVTPLVAAIVRPTHWVMERAMLRGIKRRAEGSPTTV